MYKRWLVRMGFHCVGRAGAATCSSSTACSQWVVRICSLSVIIIQKAQVDLATMCSPICSCVCCMSCCIHPVIVYFFGPVLCLCMLRTFACESTDYANSLRIQVRIVTPLIQEIDAAPPPQHHPRNNPLHRRRRRPHAALRAWYTMAAARLRQRSF